MLLQERSLRKISIEVQVLVYVSDIFLASERHCYLFDVFFIKNIPLIECLICKNVNEITSNVAIVSKMTSYCTATEQVKKEKLVTNCDKRERKREGI